MEDKNKIDELQKCKENPAYFAETYLVDDKGEKIFPDWQESDREYFNKMVAIFDQAVKKGAPLFYSNKRFRL